MNTTESAHPGWRFSLRELLLLLGFVAVGCTALKYAGEVWVTMLSAVVLLLFLGSAVVAVIDRGRRQALAIGFALCMAVYGVLFWSSTKADQGNRELDPYEGRLPTTKLLKPVCQAVVVHKWIDANTGQEVKDYDPAKAPSFFGPGVPPIFGQETPDRGHFMAVGHLLWALLLGYVGARLAGWIYGRRQQETADERPRSP